MKEKQVRRIVLGEGEAIGHKHVLESKQPMTVTEVGIATRIVVSEQGVLTHDEHDRMVIRGGAHRSYHQVEYNPLEKTVEEVFD